MCGINLNDSVYVLRYYSIRLYIPFSLLLKYSSSMDAPWISQDQAREQEAILTTI